MIKLKQFGPGIVFASTCIGVSHLVQSTRAGALYGFELVLFVLLANLFKYPFFEYGTRYAAATGQSILAGYHKESRWLLVLFLVIIVGTVFTVTAGVTIVAAGMFGNLLSIDIGVPALAAGVMILCFIVLFQGSYSILENIIKVVASLLVISTAVAFFLAVFNVQAPDFSFVNMDLLYENKSFIFIIALMGWMPSALDLTAMNSLWTVEKMKIDKEMSFRQHIFDFNLGYLVTALLAFCFLSMGALVLFESGVALSDNSVGFAAQLTGMYTSTIGDWVFVIIALSAFSTMFSTTLTVLDGYPRIIEGSINLLFDRNWKIYRLAMIALILVGLTIIVYFANRLSTLIDLATAISFVIAPIIAIINFKVVIGDQVDDIYKPKPWLRMLSYLGIVFLVAFALAYLSIYF